MQSIKTILFAGIFLTLFGCGGSSSSDDEPKQPTTETGVFIDSPVINIGYRTESLEDVTSSSGEFKYLVGETVTFFIGDLELPPVAASNVITPLDIAGSQDTSNPMVVNIIRLLQSLDVDDDPDDGITISENIKGLSTLITAAEFALPVADFAALPAVSNLVANSGPVFTLVSESDAIEHFEESLVANNIIEDPALAFTAEELTGITAYTIFNNEPDCPTLGWYAVPISFDGDNYNIQDCTGSFEMGSYTITESGMINIISSDGNNNELIRRVSFDVDNSDWSICWAKTEAEVINCPDGQDVYVFLDRNEAEAFVASQNGIVEPSPEPPFIIDVSVTSTITAYQQGIKMCEDGTNSCNPASQCDLGANKQVGGTEIYSERWSRTGDTITVINIDEPDEIFTLPFELTTSTIDISFMGTEEDPTGQTGDVFTATFDEVGQISWNDVTTSFEGTLDTENSQSWTLNSQVSTCITSYDVSATITSGDINTFLGI